MNLSAKYSPGYIDNLFSNWYLAGKPKMAIFYPTIPPDPFVNETPNSFTVSNWMKTEEWKEREESLDLERQQYLREQNLVATVEMLERHAKLGKEMQDIAMTYLQDHRDELTPGTAVRLLVDGISIEQGTASIPEMLRKMKNMRDEDLLENIEQLMLTAPTDADN